jgi:hypothetical protein
MVGKTWGERGQRRLQNGQDVGARAKASAKWARLGEAWAHGRQIWEASRQRPELIKLGAQALRLVLGLYFL